ncbi:MAG: hypothetical protein ACE5F8_05635, partial [Woeseiaceae bacterium]
KLLIVTGLALAASAQEVAEETSENSTDSESTSETETADEEEIVVDDTSYLDTEEEDFRPSEEIPADQSIAFPTDI